MKNYKLLVNTSSKKYPIIIGDKISENLNRIFKLNKINFNKCLFLIDNNLPNINFSNSFKTILKSKIDYNQENDIYTGITSKKLPLISNFLEFWKENIKYNDEIIDRLL